MYEKINIQTNLTSNNNEILFINIYYPGGKMQSVSEGKSSRVTFLQTHDGISGSEASRNLKKYLIYIIN